MGRSNNRSGGIDEGGSNLSPICRRFHSAAAQVAFEQRDKAERQTETEAQSEQLSTEKDTELKSRGKYTQLIGGPFYSTGRRAKY